MTINEAIHTHGATAVYYAAARFTEGDTDALSAVGIDGQGLGLAWRVMGAAHREMDEQDIVHEQVAVAARLANVKEA